MSPKIFPNLVKLTCRSFHDDSETIRLAATQNLKNLLKKSKNPIVLAGLIPTLESRLGAERIVEECEELRLEQLKLLQPEFEIYRQSYLCKLLVGFSTKISVFSENDFLSSFFSIIDPDFDFVQEIRCLPTY